MSKKNQKVNQLVKGFTLLEMLVVVGVFSLVVALVSDLFVNLYNLSAKSGLEKQVYQDVRYAVESISREARLAKTITADKNNDTVSFTMEDDTVHEVYRSQYATDLWKLVIETPDTVADLTSQEINVVSFDIKTVSSGNCSRPFFELYVKGQTRQATSKGEKPVFDINTIISKRIFTDLKSCPAGGCQLANGYITGSVSKNNSYLVNRNNELFGAGDNSYRQCGGAGCGNTFTKLAINEVVQVDSGERHTLVLKKDKTVWGAGTHDYGGLGTGVNNVWMLPWTQSVQDNGGTPLTNVKKIAVADMCTVALKEDGTVWAAGGTAYTWGQPFKTCTGTGGTASVPYTNPYFIRASIRETSSGPITTLDNVVDMDADSDRAIILREVGGVQSIYTSGFWTYCWSNFCNPYSIGTRFYWPYYRKLADIPAGTKIVSVSAFNSQWSAITSTGEIWNWEYVYGGGYTKDLVLTKTTGLDAKTNKAKGGLGWYGAQTYPGGMILTNAGNILTSGWGLFGGDYNALGLCGINASYLSFVLNPNISDITYLDYMHNRHSLHISSRGYAYLVGVNDYGQLGAGDRVTRSCFFGVDSGCN